MLIPGKSYSRVERHNSRVSIKTLDFVQVRAFYRCDRSWIAGRDAKGVRSPAGLRCCSWLMWGPDRLIDIACGGWSAITSPLRIARLCFDRCTTAPETWPLPVVLHAHPLVSSTDCPSASNGGGRRFPSPPSRAAIGHCTSPVALSL